MERYLGRDGLEVGPFQGLASDLVWVDPGEIELVEVAGACLSF